MAFISMAKGYNRPPGGKSGGGMMAQIQQMQQQMAQAQEELAEEIQAEQRETRPGGNSGAGQRISNFDPSMLSFDTEAAPITPAKSQ